MKKLLLVLCMPILLHAMEQVAEENQQAAQPQYTHVALQPLKDEQPDGEPIVVDIKTAEKSGYIKNFLSSGMQLQKTTAGDPLVNLPGLEHDQAEWLVNILQNGVQGSLKDLSSKDLANVYKVADFYDIQDLTKEVMQVVTRRLATMPDELPIFKEELGDLYEFFNKKIAQQILDANKGQFSSVFLLHTLQGHESLVHRAVYNPAGTQIVTASEDRTAKIWDAQTGQLLHTLQGHEKPVSSAEYNSAGTQIVTASSDGTAKIWDAQTGQLLHTLQGHARRVISAEYNPAGAQIVTASWDETAKIWDAQTGQLLHTLQGHEKPVSSAVYNSAGTQIVTASYDRTAKIWDAETGQLLHTLQGHEGFVYSAVYNPAGTRIVTASFDGTAKIWDAETGQLQHTLKGHEESVFRTVYNPAGTQIVTASEDRTAKIWDAQTGQLLHTLQGHEKPVSSAEYNSADTQIVTASSDGTAKIWDAQTGQLLHTLQGHASRVYSAEHNPVGTQIVTAAWDKTAKIWDIVDIAAENETSGYTLSSAEVLDALQKLRGVGDDAIRKKEILNNLRATMREYKMVDQKVKKEKELIN